MNNSQVPALPSDYCDLERCMTLHMAARMYKIKPDVLLYFIRFGFVAATYEQGVWLVSDTSMKRNFGKRAQQQRDDVPAYVRFNIKTGYLSPRGELRSSPASRRKATLSEAPQGKWWRTLRDSKKR